MNELEVRGLIISVTGFFAMILLFLLTLKGSIERDEQIKELKKEIEIFSRINTKEKN